MFSESDESDDELAFASTSPSSPPPPPRHEGMSLAQLLAREGVWDEARVIGLARALAKRLGAAHVRGIVHRDLRPANVLVAEDGVRVLGLGETSDGRDDASLLRTPLYMSPEQWHGGAVGPWSDVYAFGAILYELCTGTLPIRGRGMVQIARNVLHAEVPPMRTTRPDLSPAFDGLVLACLNKNPARRPSLAYVMAALPNIPVRRVAPPPVVGPPSESGCSLSVA